MRSAAWLALAGILVWPVFFLSGLWWLPAAPAILALPFALSAALFAVASRKNGARWPAAVIVALLGSAAALLVGFVLLMGGLMF